MTDAAEKGVIWQPSEKQAEFLACPDYEVLYGGAAGGGKALALNTPIPTPTGWTTMGDLFAGDVILGRDGKPCRVTKAFDVIKMPESYKVVFDDGSTFLACANHKWLTFTRAELSSLTRRTPEFREARRSNRPSTAKGNKSAVFSKAIALRNAASASPLPAPVGAVRTTAEIAATQRNGLANNHAVPVAQALDLPYMQVPLDPYVLGAWLGDGDSRRGYLTSNDSEIVAEFEAAGFAMVKQKASLHFKATGLTTILSGMGLLQNKNIPLAYLRGSQEQRLALLQGLMDTDGFAKKTGAVEFTTTRLILAEQTLELIVSLGWKACISEGRAKLNGKDCGPKYRITWSPDRPVFRLPRKLERWKPPTRRTTAFRYIVSCERVQPVPMRCIAVDSADHLFLAGASMVPTHNSDGLLIDLWCLQHDGPSNPNHRAIFFRRTFPELKDAIDRARELFPLFISGIQYNKVEHIFTAPSGAKFEFGYLQNDNDRFKARGRAWNAIGFDELTLWATPVCYEYLMSRNRSTDRSLPKYMRATTNPDGPGQKWVMDRWGISEEGKPTRTVQMMDFEVPDGNGGWRLENLPIARTFIPAKLIDNPHLRGTGYRETLMMLPEEEREALLDGLWTSNRVKGAYYYNYMQKARQEGRVCTVPHQPGLPTNTFWDLGKNDTTAIWMHQAVGAENRFWNFYQNSGVYLPHYVSYLQGLAAEQDVTWGTHYLPHDARHETLGAKSILTQLHQMWPGQRFEVVPRIPRTIDGINMTRACFQSFLFDKKNCADGIAALDLYRAKYDNRLGCFTDEPEHDRASNPADALRQFAQGYPGARRYVSSAIPEWKKKLLASRQHAGRSYMTS